VRCSTGRRMGVNLCLAASLSLRPRSLTDSRLAQQAQRKWPQRKRMGSRAAAPRVARVAASAAPPRPVRVLMYVVHPHGPAPAPRADDCIADGAF